MTRTNHYKRGAAGRGSPVSTFLSGALVGGFVIGVLMWADRRAGPELSTSREAAPTPASEYVWTQQPVAAFPIPPYARFLDGVRIVLDPGHVGQRDPGGTWKRGPTGLREAEINLRVAQFLRDFLAATGAEVVLTREKDESLDLPDRADLEQRIELANRLRADLFVSIHHNGNGDPQPNFTAVFYHGPPEHSPASLVAGRYLLAGINDALRLRQHLECALLGDDALYPDQGLRVLRLAEVPALLTEASFHSNPQEERRLRDPVYNRREAYGMFIGLARWAQAGLPRVALLSPRSARVSRGDELVVELDDGLSGRGGWAARQPKILPDTIVARLNGDPLRHRFDARQRQLRLTIPRGVAGRGAMLRVDFANIFGQHVLHPRIPLEIAP